MNVNDVVNAGNKYIKLAMGESIIVRFENKFEESKGEHNGRSFVTYNCPCYIRDGGETVSKVWSGSSNFFSRCVEKASEAGMDFEACNFKIGKIQTEDGKTGWDIYVMNAGVAETAPAPQPVQEGFPNG